MAKVNEQVAKQEVEQWLDAKKIPTQRRKEYEDGIETLISAVCEGTLSLDSETHHWKHKLSFPIGSEVEITELDYKPRLTVKEMRRKTKALKSAIDVDGRLVAIISALTDQPTGVIDSLESSDYSTAKAIALFFLN
jgi:hypothetical protein